MKKLLLLCIGVALLAAATASYAYPTLVGPTGTGVLPTAAVEPHTQFDVAADFVSTHSTFPIRALYGIAPGWELGADYTFASGGNTWGVNTKYLFPFQIAGGGISLGALYASTGSGATPIATKTINAWQAYLVGDFPIIKAPEEGGLSLIGSVGVNWTTIDYGSFHPNAFRVYANGDLGITPKLHVVGDVQSQSDKLGDTAPLYSVAARYYFTQKFGAQLGFTSYYLNGLIGRGTNLFGGVDFAFGGPKAETKGICCPTGATVSTSTCSVCPTTTTTTTTTGGY